MLEDITGQDIKNEFKKNKTLRMVSIGVGAVVLIILGYFLYKQFIWKPANEKSMDSYYAGLNYAAKDSTNQAISELSRVVKKYDGKVGGELAQFVLARQHMEKGEFKKALEELQDVNVDDQFVAVYSIGLQGDCYSEMGNYKMAIELYEEAAHTNENEKTSPEYLFKAGLCAEEMKNPEKAHALYNEIKDNYRDFANYKTIDKYIARVANQRKK
ncbi:MAG: tetratricopeptide repeat protein [Bacteroidetes bacterium]|nr:MAG: tetratricopeptide repeat protein [Bacteroidota bacterium]